MPNETHTILDKISTKAGWQNGLVKKQTYKRPRNNKLSFQYYIANNAFDKDSLNMDAIYFANISPVIYIKQLKNYNPTEVIKIQKKYWNECRTPITLIITPDTIKILDNFAKPGEIDNIEYGKGFGVTETELERLADLLKQSKLDSEKVFGKTIKLKTDQRVDKKLIEQLRETRKQLHDNYKLDFSTIHDLLGRSLFTLYLEQRKILDKEDIKLETQVSDNFFDLLQNHPNETYVLFDFLKEKFNGDLFPITYKEKQCVKENPEILNLIYNCFTGKEEIKTRKTSLFNLFDFKYIPIELISAIYEEFMGEEDEKQNKIIDNKEKSKRELGAYYTPQMLVEFVYNEVLPMPSKNDHNYNVKILDPACGSGIFLVEGFKRLIERWKFTHKETELTKETLSELLLNNIYGIEIHSEAIKITAFSLYLTFLHYMNPKEILRKVRFKPLVLWTKPKEVEQRDEKKFGLNLLQANTFIREGIEFKENPIEKVTTFFNTQFNIVIGNPPWKSGNVDEEIKIWAKQEGWDLERDIIKGYLAYTPTIAPKATIALISSAKVLFNTSGTDDKFRCRFFSENKVSVIVNFAVVRHVLFENAKQAASLIIYTPRNKKEIAPTESILYCVPKTSSSIQNRNAITIDASEIKFLPIHEVLKPNSKVFKITMYGNIRDLKFINRLNRISSINDITADNERGIGLKTKGAKEKNENKHLINYYQLPKEKLQSYYVPFGKFIKLGNDYIKYRTNNHKIFDPPLILINEGTKKSTLCVSYIDYSCVYPNSIYGISLKNKSEKYHKALTVCLNSTLAKYYYFLISSNWGVSKGGQLLNNEATSFPAILEIFSQESINQLAKYYDEIKNLISGEGDFTRFDNELVDVQKLIDDLLYNELKITKTEQMLMDHVLHFSKALDKQYKISGAEKQVNTNDIKQYVQTYLEVINKHYKNSTIRLRAKIYTNSKFRDELVCVKFLFDKNTSTHKSIEESEKEISKILNEINEYTFDKYSASIYYRRIIKYDLKNAFYLIKPNQKRFWSKALALNDADNLIVEIINQYNS